LKISATLLLLTFTPALLRLVTFFNASISYRTSDISLKKVTFYDIIPKKEGAFMSENKLLDLSFEFAVAIINLVDGVTAPRNFAIIIPNRGLYE